MAFTAPPAYAAGVVPGAECLQCVDDQRVAAPRPTDQGPGHGLTGMRERTVLLGGALTAGPVNGGGFSVTAVLPFTDIS